MSGKLKLIVDSEKCLRDGKCEWICSGKVIKTDINGFPYIDSDLENFCFGCGQCVAICPTGSLIHTLMAPSECEPIIDEMKLTKEQVRQQIMSRRSIRNYKKQSISRNEIEELISVAKYAPTGGNFQGVHWIVLDDKKIISTVVEWTKDYLEDFVKQPGNEWLLLPADAEQLEDYIFWDAPAVILATADNQTDLSIALSYFDLYAQASGYGCCWAGYLNFALDGKDSKLINLFEKYGLKECYYPMMIGVPEEDLKYFRIPKRKPASIQYVNDYDV